MLINIAECVLMLQNVAWISIRVNFSRSKDKNIWFWQGDMAAAGAVAHGVILLVTHAFGACVIDFCWWHLLCFVLD